LWQTISNTATGIARIESNLVVDLDTNKSAFDSIFREDHTRLRRLIRSKKKQNHIQLDRIEQNYLLVKGLSPIDESKLQDKRELVINSLSHWFMSVYALKMIFREIIDELRTAKEQYNDVIIGNPGDDITDTKGGFDSNFGDAVNGDGSGDDVILSGEGGGGNFGDTEFGDGSGDDVMNPLFFLNPHLLVLFLTGS
jgi:hypothetical protein